MKIKDKVLSILEKNKGNHISGSVIAKELHVSRNSIWKAIKQLEEEGHRISAVTNKGYCLDLNNEYLSEESIKKYLLIDHLSIKVDKIVDSTNSQLKIKAEAGAPEGSVLISEEQTKGRGRMGRSFFSPEKTGIYMSILLRPKISAYEALSITTCAAVAVAKAIEKNTNKKAGIKWVNDIFIEDKKVCGILTEASMNLEGGGLRYAILGIGINAFSPKDGFPEELEDITTFLFNEDNNYGECRSKLIADILNIFFDYYKDIENKPFYKDYKDRSIVSGKKINIIRGDVIEKGIALDIDENFLLKVKKENGNVEYLNSAEVSIRQV